MESITVGGLTFRWTNNVKYISTLHSVLGSLTNFR